MTLQTLLYMFGILLWTRHFFYRYRFHRMTRVECLNTHDMYSRYEKRQRIFTHMTPIYADEKKHTQSRRKVIDNDHRWDIAPVIDPLFTPMKCAHIIRSPRYSCLPDGSHCSLDGDFYHWWYSFSVRSESKPRRCLLQRTATGCVMTLFRVTNVPANLDRVISHMTRCCDRSNLQDQKNDTGIYCSAKKIKTPFTPFDCIESSCGEHCNLFKNADLRIWELYGAPILWELFEQPPLWLANWLQLGSHPSNSEHHLLVLLRTAQYNLHWPRKT